MKKSNRYTSEFRERAIRLVTTQQHEYPSLWAALVSISDKLGCTPETLRAWVKKSQAQPSKPSSNTQSNTKLPKLSILRIPLKNYNSVTVHKSFCTNAK
jgi:transposase